MIYYRSPEQDIWQGRTSGADLYLHEVVRLSDIENIPSSGAQQVALLGYACDEGVKRNQGRGGAEDGPAAIRKMMASLSNHLPVEKELWDAGDIVCSDEALDEIHEQTASGVSSILRKNIFPLVLGGGHDLAYPHYKAIKEVYPDRSVGIINLDAHFDLRPVEEKRNSGTPFWQIAREADEWDFHYFCLGIQEESNNQKLYQLARDLGVQYISNREFRPENMKSIIPQLDTFIDEVDLVYLTVDMDGFSSAIAPGVSAPSPLGFGWEAAFALINHVCASGKLISADVIELNPAHDHDFATARLAARVAYEIIRKL